MESRFAKKARTVLTQHAQPETCSHRGKTLRVETKSCCGEVEIFYCAARKREVLHTKCKRCEHFGTS